MLVELRIAGLGVIEEVDLELGTGLTVLTGETGAGKTMVTVALGLALGSRASTVLVREGARQASVEARFTVPDHPELGEWAEDGELILARRMGGDGRAAARAGGQLVPVSTLAALAPRLVEVHGQHEHQRLLGAVAQTAFLDRFAGPDHVRRLDAFRVVYGELSSSRSRLEQLSGAARERARERDLLAYQVREIEAAGVVPGELGDLEREEARLGSAERLSELATEAGGALSGGDGSGEGATGSLAAAAAAMGRAAGIDAGAEVLAARLRSLSEEAADAASEVRAYAESAQADPVRLEEVRARRAALVALERKYGDGAEGILRYLEEASAGLRALEGSDAELDRLQEAVLRLQGQAEEGSAGLRRGREAAAGSLSAALGDELAELGMEGASIEVRLVEGALGPDGTERAEILLSPGPGQALLPLSRAASGGELSRTMLACRSVLANLDDVPTLVFDEVDAGIGGRAGVAVGRRLARIARTRQVLAVTHLPQIAAFADRHVVVEKARGIATVRTLDDAGRVGELSRMLAGLPTSEAASTHAEELLGEAAREKAAAGGSRR